MNNPHPMVPLALPRNWGVVGPFVSPTVLDTIAPASSAIIAAANVTRTASGLFVVGCSYAVTTGGADDVVLGITGAPGTTAWSGGTPSPDGTWLVDINGPIMATSSGTGVEVGGQSLSVAGIQPILLSLTTLVDFFSVGAAIGSKNLITIGVLNGGSAGLVGAVLGKTFFYELP